MKQITTKRIDNTALFFILIAPFTIAFYASYVFNPIHRGTMFLYLMLLTADSIAIINLAALWITILLDLIRPEYHKRDIRYNANWVDGKKLSVDVFIPVTKEPLKIIKETISQALHLDYPHMTYVLDDGPSDDVKDLAQHLGVTYLARPSHVRHYAKSGNLNFGLEHSKGNFVAVFDADHVPKKNFLQELLPFFENEKVALVQTPQHYINTNHFIAKGTADAQEIFYKYIQPAKNGYNASFCVGTNMIYRRRALEEIGGIALLDHSEDIWTTILLHEKGWESIFYNKILAEGRAPETIRSFFRQQNRWARGGFSLFFVHNPLFIPQLNKDQKLQYFFSNIHYFTAFSILIYLLIPIIYLLTGLHPMDVAGNNDWPIHYIPYFITAYFLPFFLSGKLSVATISTAIASFFPYIQAFFSVIVKTKYTWVATEVKRTTNGLLIADIWPHLFLIVLSLFAICVGWFTVTDVMTTLTVTFWTLVNTYMLFAFVKSGILEEL